MARPKTGKPPKKNLTLTVDEQTREQLDLLSQHRQQSISSMVAEWVDQEVKRLNLITNEPKENGSKVRHD